MKKIATIYILCLLNFGLVEGMAESTDPSVAIIQELKEEQQNLNHQISDLMTKIQSMSHDYDEKLAQLEKKISNMDQTIEKMKSQVEEIQQVNQGVVIQGQVNGPNNRYH